jgi:hypothetical protein
MEVLAQSFTINTPEGHWLGQVVITADGMISGVTDLGNFSLAFRSFDADKSLAGFKQFIKSLGEDYFAGKINSSLSYMATSKQLADNCKKVAHKILPALKAAFDPEKPQVIVEEVILTKGAKPTYSSKVGKEINKRIAEHSRFPFTQGIYLTLLEREKQLNKWGNQNHHSLNKWVVIMAEEVGEVSKAVLENDIKNIEEEVVQVATVCMAMLEGLWDKFPYQPTIKK